MRVKKEINIQIGEQIKTAREQAKLTQEQLAELCDCTSTHISNIENGKSIPSLETFADICIALSTTPDYLLLGTLKSNSVPQTIIDGLNLCYNESLSIINDIISCFIKNNR